MASQLASALQLASAAAPIAKQIAGAFGLGKSRNARRRRNRKASRGQQGPSALGALTERTRPSATNPSRGRRRRRGGRGRRGKRAPNYGSSGTGMTKTMSGIPIAVSSEDFQTFYRTEKAPVHKEWGEGCRVVGCSVIGNMSLPSNTGSSYCYSNAATQAVVSGGINTYFDLFVAVNTPTVLANQNRVMSLHPALISRLANESLNWGRYVYRYCAVANQPVSNTTNGDGYTVGMSHDVSWPLNGDQVNSFTTVDIAQLGKHASGAFYEPFALASGDYSGDRTWTTSLPVFAETSSGATGFESSFLAPYIDSSYQYFWTAYMPVASSGQSPGYRGWVYLTYVCDFYSVKTDSTTEMDTFSKGNIGGTIRPLPSSQRVHVAPGKRGLKIVRHCDLKPTCRSSSRERKDESDIDDGAEESSEIKSLMKVREGPRLSSAQSGRVTLRGPGGKKIFISQKEYEELMLSEEVSDLTSKLPD